MSKPPQARRLPKDLPLYELFRIRKGRTSEASFDRTWAFETALVGFVAIPGSTIFGGIIFACSVQAAFESIVDELGLPAASKFALYSFQGAFTSPAFAHLPLKIAVESARTSRGFVTRVVRCFQEDPAKAGSRRNVLIAICDFNAKGRPSLVEFDTPPLDPTTGRPWLKASECPDPVQEVAAQTKQARADSDEATLNNLYLQSEFRSWFNGLCEYVCPPNSLTRDSYFTLGSTNPSTQDRLSIHKRRLADWSRVSADISESALSRISAEQPDCVPFRPESFQYVCLAFMLDTILPRALMAVAKVPLFSEETAVTLDFCMRFHRDHGLDATKWLLRETHSTVAASGRSLNVGTLWDEEGRIVATISEQCLNTPRKTPSNPKPRERL
ncbi:hypothetical protein OC845_004909 [Tilletia horrida]|nr:hypothetical protein OC845_004909 [Tilletia horrida]